MSEKVIVELNENKLENVKSKLSELKYDVVSIPIQIKNDNDKNTRITYF